MQDAADDRERVTLPSGWPTVPPELAASVTRHRAHLAELIGTLRASGVDPATIDTSINRLLDSYRIELTAAIHAMMGSSGHA